MSSLQNYGWKQELVNKFVGASHDVDENEETVKKTSVYIEGDDDNNNLAKLAESSCEGSREAAAEIVKHNVSSVANCEFETNAGQDSLIEQHEDDAVAIIDASKVVFSCQDVRLKPGFVMPVAVKPRRIAVKKVVVDTIHHGILALPGEAVIIPDIAEETWMEASDNEFGQELADRLHEDKTDMIISLVETLGRDVVLDYFWETQKIEESGGLLIMNGARRRTSGGVLLQLLRVTKDEKIKEKVEIFFHERNVISHRKTEAECSEKKKKMENDIQEFLQEQNLNNNKEVEHSESDSSNSNDIVKESGTEGEQSDKQVQSSGEGNMPTNL